MQHARDTTGKHFFSRVTVIPRVCLSLLDGVYHCLVDRARHCWTVHLRLSSDPLPLGLHCAPSYHCHLRRLHIHVATRHALRLPLSHLLARRRRSDPDQFRRDLIGPFCLPRRHPLRQPDHLRGPAHDARFRSSICCRILRLGAVTDPISRTALFTFGSDDPDRLRHLESAEPGALLRGGLQRQRSAEQSLGEEL